MKFSTDLPVDGTAPSLSTPPGTPFADPAPRPRLMSVDALRGFDMFWLIGGEEVARALGKMGDGALVRTLARQLQHVEWAGFRFYDAIFPLFLFLVGVSITLSMDRRRMVGKRTSALGRIARRSALLFVIGIFYYGGISRTWPDVALSGVLHRIALCYLVAATLHLFLPRPGIVIAAAVSLVGYWAMLTFVPFPDVNLKQPTLGKDDTQESAKTSEELFSGAALVRGTYEEGHNFAHYVDALALPGRKRNLYYTNEGLLSTIPAVATTLFGIMAGWVLADAGASNRRKVAWLLGAGAAGIALGCLWGLQFPIVKRLWTSSFCLVASGVSAMLLGVFYLVVDVWRWQRWCLPLLWIGSNALTVYVAVTLLNFDDLATRFAGGDVEVFFDSRIAPGFGGLVLAILGLLMPILLVRFLYQRKIFLRL